MHTTRIKEIFSDATVEQINDISGYIDQLLELKVSSVPFDKTKVNLINVDIGKMSYTKAREYIDQIAAQCNQIDSTMECLFVAMREGHASSVIELSDASIIKISVGHMSDELIESYMTKFRPIEEKFERLGYKISFIAER